MRKTIEIFTFTYNDEDLLPFFLNYYAPLVDRITFMDSGSTDKTLSIIKKYSLCFNVRVLQTGLTWWDWDTGHMIRCNIWKGSSYDLIMLPDVDEIFYRPDLREYLDATDFGIYQLEGWQMVSKDFPKPKTDLIDINKGERVKLYDKFSIFKPTAKIKMTSNHEIASTTESLSKGQIKLLHYKFVGVEFLLKRAEAIKRRVPKDSYTAGIKGNILKIYPGFIKSRQEYEKEIDQLVTRARQVV
jgi:glycosyltransferase involved in cell wall biosynthesis